MAAAGGGGAGEYRSSGDGVLGVSREGRGEGCGPVTCADLEHVGFGGVESGGRARMLSRVPSPLGWGGAGVSVDVPGQWQVCCVCLCVCTVTRLHIRC